MKKIGLKLAFLVMAVLVAGAAAQHRDPLTDVEANQLRDTADDPPKRLGFMIKFARARLDAIDQLRADPKAEADRGTKVRDLLQEFGAIIDELDDNIDDYADRNIDLRKPLKEIIEADGDFQNKLKALTDAAADPHTAAQAREYKFVLQDSRDSLNSNLDNAKKLLAEQNANKGELKKQ